MVDLQDVKLIETARGATATKKVNDLAPVPLIASPCTSTMGLSVLLGVAFLPPSRGRSLLLTPPFQPLLRSEMSQRRIPISH